MNFERSTPPPAATASTVARARERAVARFLDIVSRDAMLRARLRGGEPTTHRLLAPAGGRPDPALLHRIVEEAAELPHEPVVLDAGCGLGDLMIDLAKRRGGSWTGLTFSPIQAERARAAAVARGLIGAIAVHLRAPDDPPAQPHDAVIAVEALCRCRNPAPVLAGLARTLRPGGRLVLVEDMIARDAAGRSLVARLMRAPGLADEPTWRARIEAAGLTVAGVRDLSHLVPERSSAAVERLISRLGTARRLLPIDDLRRALDARLGALALEQLLRRGEARYVLLSATRQVS